MPKVLFLVKKRSDSVKGLGFGLGNSASFVSEFLKRKGIESKNVMCIDANYIDKHVTENDPDIVILEALWVTPLKIKEILSIKKHQKRTWVVRIHSRVAFLAYEGNAFAWLKGYHEVLKNFPNIKFVIAPNTDDFAADLSNVFGLSSVYLPNIYSENYEFGPKPPQEPGKINIGCFGAIRPFKNHLTQSLAAIHFANQHNFELNFHVNGDRCEQTGDCVLKNLHNVFEMQNKHTLVKHPWMEHDEFITVIRKMDLGLQVSFSETFNLVAADFVTCDVPIVVSNQIKWLPTVFQVNECNSVQEIVDRLNFTWSELGKSYIGLNKIYLAKSNVDAEVEWMNFLLS
jgi:glycosyltransferase involved in cell wall biosynthesis